MSIYSQLKPAWHLDRIQSLRDGRQPAPVHVQLVLSDLCNQSCQFCAYRMPTGLSNELFPEGDVINPNRRIPTAKALEIVEDCAALGVKAIQFTGGGEPTVHTDHLEIFAAAQELGIATALVTNGVKLNAAHPAIQRMRWVRVSVDAGTPETYGKVRQVAPQHWEKAWRSIHELAETCAGVVSVGFVVTPDNYTEIRQAAELCKQAGVANMRVGAVFSNEGTDYYGTLRPKIRAAIDQAKDAVPGFEIADLFDRRMGDLEDGAPEEAFCGYQYLTTYIGGDLGVYRCCNTAYTRRGKIADLHGMRLRDLYGGPLHDFDARACRFCQFNGQNKALSALVAEPEHSEFV